MPRTLHSHVPASPARMTARYAGTCAATGKRFAAGATIDYDRGTRTAVLISDAQQAPAPEGRYISDVVRFSSGATFYRNKRGRCEDAPCCGCCTI